MSKMTWPDEDANEFDDLVDEALRHPAVSDRSGIFLAGLDDALQAQRYWALDVMADIRREGARKILNKEAEKRRPRVPVAESGEVLGKMPRDFGRRVRALDGKVSHQRGLFDLMSWDELKEKRAELLRQSRAITVDVKGIDVLLSLEERAPGAANPDEACRLLGTTVEEFLAGAA